MTAGFRTAVIAAAALLFEAQAAAIPFSFRPGATPRERLECPLERVRGGLFAVRACAGGVPCKLLVDTGATHTTFDAAFAAKHFPHPGTGYVKIHDTGDTNVAADPGVFRLPSLSLGDAVFGAFDAMTLDLSHVVASVGGQVDGVLGMNVLGSVPSIVSFGSARLVLNPSREDLSGFGRPVPRGKLEADPFSVVFDAGLPDGGTAGFLLDSGSSVSFVREDCGWKAAPDAARSGLDATGVNGRTSVEAVRGETGAILAGCEIVFSPVISNSAEPTVGADVLSRHDVYIGRRSVAFRPSGAAAAAGADGKDGR